MAATSSHAKRFAMQYLFLLLILRYIEPISVQPTIKFKKKEYWNIGIHSFELVTKRQQKHSTKNPTNSKLSVKWCVQIKIFSCLQAIIRFCKWAQTASHQLGATKQTSFLSLYHRIFSYNWEFMILIYIACLQQNLFIIWQKQ